MASNVKEFLKNGRVKHAVGNITSWNAPKLFTNGAVVTEVGGVDNYTLVELAYVEGQATVKYATAGAKALNVFLVATPEEVLSKDYNEQLADFFNAKGDYATLIYPEVGLTFETSAIAVETVNEGDFVVWDATTKKFIKNASLAGTEIKVFQVISKEVDERYLIDGSSVVELAIVK